MSENNESAYSIYLITNIVNNKIYVGYTKRDIKDRWKSHCYLAYGEKAKNKALGHGAIMSSAIRKYEKESFTIETIDTANSHEEACEKEIFWIAKLGSKSKNGYNLTLGGEGVRGFVMQDWQRKQLSEQNIGENNYWYGKRGQQHFGYGKTLDEDHIFKLKEANYSNIPVVINGVTYRSKAYAAECLHVGKTSVDVLASWESNISSIRHRRVVIDGVLYFGIKSAAKILNTSAYKLKSRLDKSDGASYIESDWTFDQFLQYTQSLKKSPRSIIYKGVTYRSINSMEKELGIDYYTIENYIKSGEAVEIEGAYEQRIHNAIPVTFCGETFKSKSALMNYFGISGKEFNRLLDLGEIV